MIFKCLDVDKMPKFGAPVYLENKTMIGKVEEIFGNVATPVCLILRFHRFLVIKCFIIL